MYGYTPIYCPVCRARECRCVSNTDVLDRAVGEHSSAQLPLQAALGDFGTVKTALDRDQAAMGVDPAGEPPFTFHTHIPMDEGASECRQGVDRGFYRAYDANWTDTPTNTVEMPLVIDGLDVKQIGWEIARESPVTGSVVFRLVDGRIVAQLTSYVAFA